MKKHLLVALAIALALALAIGVSACGDSGGDSGGTPDNNFNTTTPPHLQGGDNNQQGGDSGSETPASNVPQKGDNERTHNFTWAHPYPATHHHHADIILPFVDRVFEASEGTINITVIPGGAITTTATAVDDVTSGAVDLTWTLPGNTPGRFPLLTCFEFMDHFTSAVEATEAMWGVLYESEAFRNEFSAYKLFNVYGTEMGEIWTIDQVRTPSDLAGMPLRAASPMSERMLRAYGAVTVGMGMPDVYDNIERGVIRGLGTAPSAIPTYNLNEILDHGTDGLYLYTTTQIMAMSWRAWSQLSPWQQYIFDSVSGLDFAIESAQLYDDLGNAARQNIPGLQLNRLTDAEKALFKVDADRVIADYMAEITALGHDAQAHYNTMLSVRDALRAR